MKPLLVNFFVTLSIGAIILIFFTFLVNTLSLRENESWFPRLSPTDRNIACSLLELVILVFVSERSKNNSSFKNTLMRFIIVTQSSLDPLTPMIQSSAYLIYSNFLKLGSISNFDGILSNSLCIDLFSSIVFALCLRIPRAL